MSTKLSTEQTTAALDLLNKLVSSYELGDESPAGEYDAVDYLMQMWSELSEQNNRRIVREYIKARAEEQNPGASAAEIRDITNRAVKIYHGSN